MILLFFLLAGVCLIGCEIRRFNEGYISYSNSNAIKGILAVIILLSHMRGYVTLSDSFLDSTFLAILTFLGQLMVAPYFFYSGYGIMESIAKKPSYMKQYPRKRILKTLIHFDTAVLMYIIVMSIIGFIYPAHYYLTCWVGWDSVGNSNWFIFDILVLYVLFYSCYRLSKKLTPPYSINKDIQQFIMLSLYSLSVVILWVVLAKANKGCWWIDTLFTFPLGAWFSYYRSKFEKWMRCSFVSVILLLVLSVIFTAWKTRFGNDIYGITACIFCLLLIVVCTKLDMNNKYLQWLGTHAFSIYIIQRLPMNLFAHLGLDANPYIFAALSIPSALFFAYLYNKILAILDLKVNTLFKYK